MNGYKLTQKLRKIRSDTYLSATDQALFHELVSICNEKKWDEIFSIKSNEICSSLNISDNTLNKSRKKLEEVGLIFSKSSKDKRIGCYYSFVSELSSSIIADEKVKTLSNIADDIEIRSGTSFANIEHDTQVESSATVEDENNVSYAIIENDNSEENAGSSSTSSANIEHDTQFPPYKRIKTINRESLAHTHESSPPEKKKNSRKKKGDSNPLTYPFESKEFFDTWNTLIGTPKWEKKMNYALQLSLNKLAKYPEEFAIYQINRAIESNWVGVVFPGTDRDFEEWKRMKHGKSISQTSSQSASERKADAEKFADLAEGVLQRIAAEKFQ